MEFIRIILSIFLIICLFAITSARLCAEIHKRGSTTPDFNLTIGEGGIARGIFTRRLLGQLTPQPGCILNLDRGGAMVFGRENQVKRGIDIEQTIGKDYPGEMELCCTCDTLACEMVDLAEHACARLFSADHCSTCQVNGLTVYPGDSDSNMQYGNIQGKLSTGNGILSLVVNWDCKLTLYEKVNYRGKWRSYYNGFDRLGSGWYNPVGSYKCECRRPTQQVAEWITLFNPKSQIDGNQTSSETENKNKNNTRVDVEQLANVIVN